MAWSAMTNRTPARDRSGALGWRRGSQYRGSRVTPVEGRDLSSRQTQYVVKDLEIGQPINSENSSEAADGVARESVKSCPRAGCGRSACPVRRAGCGNGVTVEPLRHRQTKEAENRYVLPKATAPHLDSTNLNRNGLSAQSPLSTR